MHVSNLPCFGSLGPGIAAPTETTTCKPDRTPIARAYPEPPHRVVSRQYPTQGFPKEPDYAGMFATADDIQFAKDEVSSYIGAAADVIVTMTPTGTQGWCVGTGVPIVRLDARKINPLSDDDMRKTFCDAFLFVSIDEEAWPDRLAEIP